MSNSVTVSTNDRVSASNLIVTEGGLDKITRFSNMLAQSSMTPNAWKNKPIDCGLITMKALQLGFNPLDFIQGVYEVKGNVSYKSSMIIAMIHSSGLVVPRTFTQLIGEWEKLQLRKGSKFHGNESGLGLRVGFKFIGDEDVTWGSVLMLEPQSTRNSSLWETDLQTQLTYLAARRWSNVYLPGVTMGMVGKEEAEDFTQPGERDITPQAPSMVSGEEIQFAKKETPVEVQADIEDYQEEVIAPEPVKQPEPVKEPEQEKTGPQEGDLDALGTPFESEFMTGTTLKSDSSWRLNKAGQARKAALEAQEEPQQEEPQQGNQVFMVKAVHPESIDMLGGEGPFKVISFDEQSGLVQLEGQEDMLPITDNGEVYLERVVEVSEAALKSKESLDAVNGQFKGAVEKLNARIANIGNAELENQATEAVKKWEDHAKKAIAKVAAMGNKATQEDFDSITESNKSFWNESLAAIKHFEAQAEKEDSPFGGQ
ncbi:RecT family protein [Vibrio phage 1.111.B._10N.286.45.E6]|nr:RecT family protein [Vibrio phage 1.111.A._10N.286.45.E6]AUR88292.1 RecT family protein [Vibrio phage 1.111.B._10N.286.45.E6]